MRQIRIYSPQDLFVEAIIELTGNVKRHIDNVLRLKAGAHICLFNGDGYDYHGEILQIDRHIVQVRVLSKEFVDNECDIAITLYCALLKNDTMDRVIQKAVELGVKTLVPVETKHGEVRLKPQRLASKIEHWQGVIHASSQQCGRAQLMALSNPMSFAKTIKQAHDQRWIFSPHHSNTNAQATIKDPQSVGLLIGPEGGFHASEVEAAISDGWQSKTLGPRILRADTAAISSVLKAQFTFSAECSNA